MKDILIHTTIEMPVITFIIILVIAMVVGANLNSRKAQRNFLMNNSINFILENANTIVLVFEFLLCSFIIGYSIYMILKKKQK